MNYDELRARYTADMDKAGVPPILRHNINAVIDFSKRHNVQAVVDLSVNLWSYGDIEIMFISRDNPRTWWASIERIAGPTGLTLEEIEAEYASEYAEREETEAAGWYAHADQIETLDGDGNPAPIRLFSMHAVLGIFLGLSPWKKEFAKAVMPAMRRAAVASGLAASFEVVRVDETGTATKHGETLADVIAADGVPTAEEARALAFAGPAAFVNGDADE